MTKIISDDIVIVVESGLKEKIGSIHYVLLNIKYKDYANININVDPKLELKELEAELNKLTIEKRLIGTKFFPYKEPTIKDRVSRMTQLVNMIPSFWLTNVYFDTLDLEREEFHSVVKECLPTGTKLYSDMILYKKKTKTNKIYYNLAKMYANYFRLKELENIKKVYDITDLNKFIKKDKECPLVRRY